MTNLDMTLARKAMIDSQLRPSGVNEHGILSRMAAVAREDFVPGDAREIAYMDRAIPLGGGRFLPSPLAHGKMLSEAAPLAEDHALIIENGNAYLAELLRPMVSALDTIDADDMANGLKGRKKYSLVLIDGAIEELPANLIKRVAEGGRIVTGLVSNGVTRLAAGVKVGGTIVLQPLAEIGIPVLHQFDSRKAWSF